MSTKEERDRVVGQRPQHTHTNAAGERWQCNSPYCEDMQVEHPSDSGREPIVQGYEPWRGR